MTASNDKTLYDKTIARRIVGSSRRTRRIAAATGSLVVMATVGAASLAPVQAQVRTAADIGGFATMSTAAPLKIEVYEPVIPIPTEPQSEIDFSYTRVIGESGPTSTARASAIWPGSGVGEGLKTFGDQLGLPAAITAGGYPAQANAQYPGDNTEAAQEPVPGTYSRVKAGDKETVAIASYSTGTPTASEPSSSGSGGGTGGLPIDLGSLGGALTGAASGGSPLGALSTLVNISGVTSISKSTNDAQSATAVATSRVGEVSMLLGMVKLNGVNVVVKTTATMAGIKTTQTVDVGSIEIAGQKFDYGPNGVTAAGSNTPLPASTVGAAAIASGISFDVPKPVVVTEGQSGSIDAQALVVTLDLGPLRKALGLGNLPLGDIFGGIPSTGTQFDILTGVLRSVNQVAPKLVLRMGQASTSAMVVPAFDMGTGDPTSTDTTDPAAGTPAGTDPAAGKDAGVPSGEIPPAAAGGEDPITSEEINPLSSVPGLPPLGSVPMWLILGGLLLGAGVGWYMRHAGIVLFGGRGAGLCNYGLKAGIPDLRKV